MERVTLFVNVILPLPISGTFTYRVPFDLNEQVEVGTRVVVQFGSRKIYTALVRSIHQKPPGNRIPKYILSVLDESPIVSEQQFAFWQWIADYYMCHEGEVMNAALPSAFKLASETKVVINPAFSGEIKSLNEKELLLLEALGHQEVIAVSDVMKILDQKKVIPVIRTMMDKGIVLLEEELKDKFRPKTEKIVSLSGEMASDENKLRTIFDQLEKRAVKQLEVLMSFVQLTGYTPGKPASIPRSVLLEIIPKGESALHALVKKEILVLSSREVSRQDVPSHSLPDSQVMLTAEQEEAIRSVKRGWEDHEVVLLHGITSSGKTEMYIRLMQETLDAGKQVLYLLPEIALTVQIISRLKKYFGERIGIYHSRFNEQEKAEIWNRATMMKYDIIVGARSAVFAPLPGLGLVIVDEEHDSSFKQFDPAPRYNGRDAGIYLAQLHGARVVLGSATPSIESYFNARQGKYGLVELFVRYGEMPMPEIKVVDIKQQHRQGKMKTHFSSPLVERVKEALNNNEQCILFQNRRGFSLRLECETCHWMPSCKNCDVTLVYHKKSNQLRCHYCGYVARVPEKCPECNGTRIRMKGFGTERVEEDLQILFPDARIARMDLDTTRNKMGYQKMINDFEERKVDILVGTQMVTKGLDFDHVSTVCILNADNMLSYPDFRSAERGFQLMTQVSGRSGRKNKRGEVIIQTWQPNHPVILNVVNHNYTAMYEQQLGDRRKFSYPPFTRIVILRVKHKDAGILQEASKQLASALRDAFGNRVFGPEYPLVSRVMNQYIKHIMIKFERGKSLPKQKNQLREILAKFEGVKSYGGTRVIADVDPM